MDTAPRPGSVSKYSPSFGELRPCCWLARMTSAHDRTLPYHVPTAAACAGVVHTDHATTSTTTSSSNRRCCSSQHLSKSVRIVSLVNGCSVAVPAIHFSFLLFSRWVSSSATPALVECCFTSTETVGLLGTGAQDGHLDFQFHTAPELRHLRCYSLSSCNKCGVGHTLFSWQVSVVSKSSCNKRGVGHSPPVTCVVSNVLLS